MLRHLKKHEIVTFRAESGTMRKTIVLGTVTIAICAGCFAYAATGKMIAKGGTAEPEVIGCGADEKQMVTQSRPLTSGPLQLKSIFCLNLPPGPNGNSPPSLSPDGTRYFSYDEIEGLWIGAVNSRSTPQHVEGRLAVSGLGYSRVPPFGWSADSQMIFGARQITANPSGFALGPVSSIVVPVGQSPRPLPALKSIAGNLDGLRWVGGTGLAVAEFGTKGRYYRPEHADPHPTIAIVDGRQGKVIQAVAMPLSNGAKAEAMIADIDARLDGRGKIYAVMFFGGPKWFEWRQGEIPRSLPIKIDKLGWLLFALAPDLKTVLVMHNLSATGIICEHNPSCPRLTPTTGVIADLRETATGRVVWQIMGTAADFSRSYKPAISPDGRYGLVTMPGSGNISETTALISMRDGRVLQRIAHPWNSECTTGFGNDGKSAWISGGAWVVIYRVSG